MQRKALGRGLEVLIPKKPTDKKTGEFAYMEVDKIKVGKYQPRSEINPKELNELKDSIKEKGFVQPIVVRKINGGMYETVAGARRLEAAKLLGLNEIPTLIKDLNDEDTCVLSIVENLQRKNLNPIDESVAIKRLMEEFDFTQEEVGKFLGKEKSSVANMLRLLKLPADIQLALKKGIITKSQARTILALERESQQRALFNEILKKGMSVREIERRVRRSVKKVKAQDPFVNDLEDKLQRQLGTKVKIFHKRSNKGKVVIEYYSLEDLDKITKRVL